MQIKNKICENCHNEFKPDGCNQKYCVNCKYVITKCVICDKEFKIKRSKYNQGRGKICSKKCKRSKKYWKDYHKKYRDKNIKKRKKYSREYRDKNINKEKERMRKYRQTAVGKEKRKIYTNNYRSKKRNNGGNFTKNEWEYIKWLYNYRCAMCQKKIKLTIDHIIPISKNGRNDFNNIQPLCLKCNCSKQDK